MGALLDGFEKAAQSRKDDESMQRIVDVVRQGLWPFEPGVVTASIEYDIDYNTDTFYLEAEALRHHRFRYKIDRRAMHQAYNPESYFFDSIAKPLVEHFRYRPSLPVDDHIVLGEE